MPGGQTIHGDDFNDERVMSTIELFDPKMDPTLNIVYVEQLIKSKSVPEKIDENTVISIMDELLCMLISSFKGDSLEESVFWLVYFHCPSLWPDERLKLFATGITKMYHMVEENCKKFRTSDEDDFGFGELKQFF
eukprot:UN33659